MAVLFNETRKQNQEQPDVVDIEKYNPYHGSDGRFSSAASAASTSSENRTKTFPELNVMAKQIGFSQGIKENVGLHVSNRCTESILTGFGDVANDFPEIKDVLTAVDTNRFGVLCTDGSTLYINPEQAGSVEIFKGTLEKAKSKDFWPKNPTFETIGAHEAGHCVEMAIINAKEKTEKAVIDAWNNEKYPKEIITKACANVRKTNYGKGKQDADLIAGISGQARLGSSEAFADAIADIQTNKKEANPLSIEISRITREMLDSAKRG